MPTVKEWAIEYRKLGLSVFPIVPGHKFPPKGFALRKCFNQLPTEQDVISWWSQWPTSDVGMATGRVSGVDVLDFDGADAMPVYEATVGDFVETIIQDTGREAGGFHALYRYHGGGLRSKKYIESNGGGVDLKTDGGLVVLSPSMHKSGNRYTWRINPILMGLNDLADFPPDAKAYFASQGVETNSKLDPAELLSKGIPDGFKHHNGFRYACRLRAHGLCFDEAIVLMEHVYSKCDPPPRDGVKKAAYDRVIQAFSKFEPGSPNSVKDSQNAATTKIKIRPTIR